VDGLTRFSILSLLISGLSIAAFTATAWYPLALAGVFFVGFAGVFGGAGTQTLMQHIVAGGLRGRVMSLYAVIYRGGPALGALAMGAMADLAGIRAAVASGAVLCLVVWAWLERRRAVIAAALESPRA
jgi:predicted MFS family arabinose efflux permease